MREHVFHYHDAVVNQHADRQRQAAQGENVDRELKAVHEIERDQQRHRNCYHQNENEADIAQEKIEHEQRQQRAGECHFLDAVDGLLDQLRLTEIDRQRETLVRQFVVQILDLREHGIGHRQHVADVVLLHENADPGFAVDTIELRAFRRAVADHREVLQPHRAARVNDQVFQLTQVFDAAQQIDIEQAAGGQYAPQMLRLAVKRFDLLLHHRQRHTQGLAAFGIDLNAHGAALAAADVDIHHTVYLLQPGSHASRLRAARRGWPRREC